jgi:dienelactone hydrolase
MNTPLYTDHTNLLVYKDDAGREHPVTTPEEWAIRRGHILDAMQEVMGPLPGDTRRVPLEMRIHQSEELPEYTRHEISYAAEPGDRVPAYLLVPHGITGPTPAMLCLHQTSTLGKAEAAGMGQLLHAQYADHLAKRGYVALAPDYPLGKDFPAHTNYQIDVYAMGYASGSMKAIWNNIRAVDLLQSLPEVNPERIGCIGHSLGGHGTLFTAAFESRLKALVVSCGFTALPRYIGGDLTGWSHSGYMPRIATVYDKDPSKVPFDFTELIATLAPRPFFANAPLHDDNFDVEGARECIAAAAPVYKLLDAEDKLSAVYPDCAHDFPADIRAMAYAWLNHWLKDP